MILASYPLNGLELGCEAIGNTQVEFVSSIAAIVRFSTQRICTMNAAEPWPPFRVLYVDDNQDVADSAALLLGLVGIEVRACYDWQTALALNESFRPGVCFLDLNMPGMGGDELAKRLRAQSWRPLLIIAVTAMSDEASRQRTAAAGFHMHLIKPVDPAKLVEVVNALFRLATSNRLGEADTYGTSE